MKTILLTFGCIASAFLFIYGVNIMYEYVGLFTKEEREEMKKKFFAKERRKEK